MSRSPVRMILDVDTGVDDALALAVAVRHPRIQLEAVLTTAGNVGLELSTRNTLRVLDWLQASEIPVFAGAAAPLSGLVREATHWHGEDGLGGAQLPPPSRSAESDAVGYLIARLEAEPGALSVVCTGPLTNMALAVQREPGIVAKVREIVLMGGVARPPGNVTPVAEFNIYADPDAAAIVFAEPWPLTMVGLDVTNRVVFTRSERAHIADGVSCEAVLVREVTRHLFDVVRVDAMALHDPLAVLAALDRSLLSCTETHVAIETRGEHTLGQTVVDLRRRLATPPATPRARVALDVDAARAKALFLDTLGLEQPA